MWSRPPPDPKPTLGNDRLQPLRRTRLRVRRRRSHARMRDRTGEIISRVVARTDPNPLASRGGCEIDGLIRKQRINSKVRLTRFGTDGSTVDRARMKRDCLLSDDNATVAGRGDPPPSETGRPVTSQTNPGSGHQIFARRAEAFLKDDPSDALRGRATFRRRACPTFHSKHL